MTHSHDLSMAPHWKPRCWFLCVLADILPLFDYEWINFAASVRPALSQANLNNMDENRGYLFVWEHNLACVFSVVFPQKKSGSFRAHILVPLTLARKLRSNIARFSSIKEISITTTPANILCQFFSRIDFVIDVDTPCKGLNGSFKPSFPSLCACFACTLFTFIIILCPASVPQTFHPHDHIQPRQGKKFLLMRCKVHD